MPLSFEQQPKESAKAFAAFSIYLSLGPQRSLRAVSQKLGKSETLIERWCRKFDWINRVQAHGAHLAAVEREATEALTRTNAAQWVTRKEEHRQEEWALRGELIVAGRAVLTKFKDGAKGATLGDVARALDLASKLGRLATGMATEKAEITGEDGGPIHIEVEAALRKIYGQAEPAPNDEPVPVVDVKTIPANQLQGPKQNVFGETPNTTTGTVALHEKL
jgi:hypothetical protein